MDSKKSYRRTLISLVLFNTMNLKYIKGKNITDCWISSVRYLFENGKGTFNLVVQIENPLLFDDYVKLEYEKICKAHNLLSIRQVSYMIFPDTMYKNINYNEDKLYKYYCKYYPRIKTSWGTYFYRMIAYQYYDVKKKRDGYFNQLKEIISMLKRRDKVYKTPYFILISNPVYDLRRPIGGPCLNYIALQLDRDGKGNKSISLLAFYRNHNFLERALGNYIGLGQLLNFICKESKYKMGYLTCISSHAYIGIDKGDANKKAIPALKELIKKLN